MTPEGIIRMEPVELEVRIGEHVQRFVYKFPPFRVAGRIEAHDGDLYAIQWNPQIEEEEARPSIKLPQIYHCRGDDRRSGKRDKRNGSNG